MTARSASRRIAREGMLPLFARMKEAKGVGDQAGFEVLRATLKTVGAHVEYWRGGDQRRKELREKRGAATIKRRDRGPWLTPAELERARRRPGV